MRRADLDTVGATADVTGNGPSYTVRVGGMVADAEITVSVPADGTSDLAGNPNVASTGSTNKVKFDNTAPTVTVTAADEAVRGSPVEFTVDFSEPVVGFTTSDVDISGSPSGAKVQSVSVVDADSYTVRISLYSSSPGGDVNVTVKADAVADMAGNVNTAESNKATSKYDKSKPAVAVTAMATMDKTPTVTGTVSDTGSGIASVAVEVDGMTYVAVVNGTAWTADVTNELEDGTYNVIVTATDNAGNYQVDPGTNRLLVDTTAPANPVIVSPEDGYVATEATVEITGTAVTGSRVQLQAGGNDAGEETIADTFGAWSVTLADLIDGTEYVLSAIATDAAGNTSATVENVSFYVGVDTLAIDLTVHEDNAEKTMISVGSLPGATDAFDSEEGDYKYDDNDGPGGQVKPAIFTTLGSGEMLVRDYRAYNQTSTIQWNVTVVAGSGVTELMPTDLPTQWRVTWMATDSTFATPSTDEAVLTDDGVSLDSDKTHYIALRARYMPETVTYTLVADWNIIGIPIEIDDFEKSKILGNAFVSAVWGWSGDAYENGKDDSDYSDDLIAKKAYWVNVTQPTVITIQGTEVDDSTVTLVDEKWNLVAPATDSINPVGKYGGVVHACFGWDTNSDVYVIPEGDELPCVPGEGYWVLDGNAAATEIWGD